MEQEGGKKKALRLPILWGQPDGSAVVNKI